MDVSSQPLSSDDPSFSLVYAVRAVARDAGHEVDFDDLLAAMGLSSMVCTVPDEPNVAHWSMYARDAFLIPAGRLFGLTIREIHPPQAARGLDHAAEFEQHFDASYRPLILRALEHGQPVLAWRGWPGERRLWWGVVFAPCDEGIGFRGGVYSSRDPSASCEPHVLVAPPTQLYVVETVTARKPVKGELEALEREQRRRVLSGEIDERFGIKVRISTANAGFNAQSQDMDKTPRKMLRLSSILAHLCDAEAAQSARQPSANQRSGAEDSGGATPPGQSPQPESGHRHRLRRKQRIPSYLTVGEIIDLTSHAGFGFLLGFLALISIPFFGLSTPFGLAIAFVAAQMALGRKHPWLPRSIRRRHVSLVALNWLSTRVARWTAGLEKVIRPRFGLFVRGPFWIACGVAIMIQGLGLALPIPVPGSNWIFIFPVMVYGIGLLEDDGVLIMAGHAITIIELVLIVRAWNAVTASFHSIWA